MKIIKEALENNKFSVEKIKLFKDERRLDIFALSDEVVNYRILHNLEDDCKNRNENLDRVSIKVKYIGEDNDDEKLKKFMPNVEYVLNKFCPASQKIENCFEIEHKEIGENEQAILISVNDNLVKERIENKKVDLQIQSTIAGNLGLDVRVFIKESSVEFDFDDFIQNNDKGLQGVMEEITTKVENKKVQETGGDIIRGKAISGDVKYISKLEDGDKATVIEGSVFASDIRKLKGGKVLQTFAVNDITGSVLCKVFWEDESVFLKNGQYIKLRGDYIFDNFAKEYAVQVRDISKATEFKKQDGAEKKRVELHMHTNMSTMEGVDSAKNIISRAKEYGHTAVAITDKNVVQAFPEAMEQGKEKAIKIIYGVEGDFIDDTKDIIEDANDKSLDQEYVVFDIETTGLFPHSDAITEIGAIKIANGMIVDRYSQLINPKMKLSKKITELTGITDAMLADKPTIDKVLPEFMEFVSGAVLVAHNAKFDTGFIRQNCIKLGIEYDLRSIDTVALARVLLPDMKSHKLDLVAKALNVRLDNHHRAVDDAQATAEIFLHFLDMLKKNDISTLNDVNLKIEKPSYKLEFPRHISILAKNLTGLKNLYKIISDSHVNHFYKSPRILKSVLDNHREGLLLGSACSEGELFQAVFSGQSEKTIEKLVKYFDYIELTPSRNDEGMVTREVVNSLEDIRNINRKIFEYAKKFDKIVVATGDVHYIDSKDSKIMDILKASQKMLRGGNHDSGSNYFRTTEEMLEEFSYLGEKEAYEIVVENTNLIADMIEEFKPIPDGTFPPIIEGSDKELRDMCYSKAKRIYGEELPEIVEKRLTKELNSIIGNGYAVMYIIAQKLVTKSIDDGYLVGSRGSVGSSFAATMSDITEVNPLPPHYVCKECRYSEFIEDGSVANGMDLPDKKCPKCNCELTKDGHDIPFETFLGFDGDKEPDIDLNFAGEYQPNAHKYTEELFGKDFVFRAGTIGTVADKTAFGFVQKYIEETNEKINSAEAIRLKEKSTGIKRTTGQHPGGVMVVPSYKDIYDFTPIQYPANKSDSGVLTTHFDYHSISGRILKLDILGHDVPTIIKMLEDMTETNVMDIKLDDKSAMSIFRDTEALDCDLSEINCTVGTLGIPEFGTKFVRQMLVDTNPQSFADLLQISGLSHGTDVWLNNAKDLIQKNVVTIKDVISTRDNIMNYLIQMKLEPLLAFKIMENVRKGKGLTDDHISQMKENGVPDWYIESCQKIKYMFPKAHAAAYVMMSFRVAYYKVFYKEAFYATFFTTKLADFELKIISQGAKKILETIKELEKRMDELTTKEKDKIYILEVAYEMCQRNVELTDVDIYSSDAVKFKIVDGKLLPPLIAIPGLGETVALNIASESKKEFLSLEDFKKRTKASNTVVETLQEFGCLKDLPQSNQLSLF